MFHALVGMRVVNHSASAFGWCAAAAAPPGSFSFGLLVTASASAFGRCCADAADAAAAASDADAASSVA